MDRACAWSDDSQVLPPEENVQTLKVTFKTLQNFACLLFAFWLRICMRVDMHPLYDPNNVPENRLVGTGMWDGTCGPAGS